MDGFAGLTDLVEGLHRTIASAGLNSAPPWSGAAITDLVYNAIRATGQVVSTGIDTVGSQMMTRDDRTDSSPKRESAIAALNGVLGDYLAEKANPLAIPIRFRHADDVTPVDFTTADQSTRKILVLVHGLCLSHLSWTRNGHNHGTALARDLGYCPVYLHYNSGLHVSTNGQGFAVLLERLLEQWPVAVDEFAIVGHSMGGLVARSAHYYASRLGHRWPSRLRKMIFLGTPHHGSPIERIGNWVNSLVDTNPFTAPFSRVGKIRSRGITDLRFGNLLDQDWEGHARFENSSDLRRPVPLPANVESYAIGAEIQSQPTGAFVGDGLVPVDSALGRHSSPERALAFPESHRWVARGMDHFDLLNHPAVYEKIRDWFVE